MYDENDLIEICFEKIRFDLIDMMKKVAMPSLNMVQMIVDSYPKIFGFESIDDKSLVNLSRYLSFLENNENFVPVILKGKPFAH